MKVFVVLIFFVIFFTAILFVRPFLWNRRRKYSTFFAKITYLLYLVILLYFFYRLMFHPPNETEFTSIFYLLIVIIVLFAPSIGLLLRRRTREYRVFYNYCITGINLLSAIMLIYLLSKYLIVY